MKPTRRYLLAGGAALTASVIGRGARAEPVLTEDGLYKQPWFLESLLELPDDLEGAVGQASQGPAGPEAEQVGRDQAAVKSRAAELQGQLRTLSDETGVAWGGLAVLCGLAIARDALQARWLRGSFPKLRHLPLSLIKDLFLLGAALWSAAESLRAVRAR